MVRSRPESENQDPLEAVWFGHLPEEEVERVLAAQPSGWEHRAFGSDRSDILMRALYSLVARPLEPDPPQVGEAIEKLLGQSASDRSTCTQATPTGVFRCGDYPQLSPPRNSDEVGRLGKYRILGVLGEGGMGTVFAAEDTELRRTVAVKTLRADLAGRSDFRDRFLREARTAAQVTHEHVIPIFDVAEENGVPYLIMPLLRGETLHDRLVATQGPLPVSDVLTLGLQITRGLAAAHARGVVHRDIKPGNVFLVEKPEQPHEEVRLLDFGLARNSLEPGHLTPSGAVLGTPGYMAPEQVLGGTTDARTDLFSLGCVLYQMATGRRPYPATVGAAARKPVAPPPAHRANPEIPAGLSRLIHRLMETDPDRRPASAGAVVAQLDRIVKAMTPPQEPRHRRLTATVAGLLGLFAVGALTAFIIIRIQSPDGKVVEVHVPDNRPVQVDANGNVKIDPGQRPARQPEVMPPPGDPTSTPLPSEPIRDFQLCHGMSGKQFDAWVTRIPDGMRLHWLDVQVFGEETRFSGIAVKAVEKGNFVLSHRILNDEVTEQREDERKMQGYRSVWDWRYQDRGHMYWSRLWTRDGQGSICSYELPHTLREIADRVLRDGFTLSALTPCQQPGPTRYILTTDSNRRPMTYDFAVPREKLSEYVKGIEARGWSLDQLTAHNTTGGLRFVVIASRNVGKPVRTVHWDVREQELDRWAAERKREGLMPWCITAYGPPDAVKYAVLCCKFEPE